MKVLILMQPVLINNCRKFHIEILSNFGEIAIFVGGHFFIYTLYMVAYTWIRHNCGSMIKMMDYLWASFV